MNALLTQSLRREAQNHFARRMSNTAVSDWTPAERKQAECLGWKLPTFRPRCCDDTRTAWSGRVL